MEEKQYKWMVCTRCVTFKQAPYIVDAMNGFTMQQTTFPFVCTIIDDFSTDGEPEVIRQYLQEHFDLDDKSVVHNEETDDYVLCFARHKGNRNSKDERRKLSENAQKTAQLFSDSKVAEMYLRNIVD